MEKRKRTIKIDRNSKRSSSLHCSALNRRQEETEDVRNSPPVITEMSGNLTAPSREKNPHIVFETNWVNQLTGPDLSRNAKKIFQTKDCFYFISIPDVFIWLSNFQQKQSHSITATTLDGDQRKRPNIILRQITKLTSALQLFFQCGHITDQQKFYK